MYTEHIAWIEICDGGFCLLKPLKNCSALKKYVNKKHVKSKLVAYRVAVLGYLKLGMK